MDLKRAFLLLVVVITSSFVRSQDAALSKYANKIVTLRKFLAGSHLEFDDQGNTKATKTCPWTLCGQIRLIELRAKGETLHLRGERHLLVPANDAKRFVDFVDFHSGAPGIDHPTGWQPSHFSDDDLSRIQKLKRVDLEIRRQGGWDDAAVDDTMRHVFLTTADSLADLISPALRPTLCAAKLAAPAADCESHVDYSSIAKVGGEVKPPRAIYAPDPKYTEAAQQCKYQGTVVLWLVVSEQGLPTDIRIARVLGLGLDEEAVAAVSRWKFEPAKRNGEPVAVQINVEVNFRLY